MNNDLIAKKIQVFETEKSEFVERFPELSLFYRLFSPLDSERDRFKFCVNSKN